MIDVRVAVEGSGFALSRARLGAVTDKRTDLFLTWVGVIDMYTLDRARKDLATDE